MLHFFERPQDRFVFHFAVNKSNKTCNKVVCFHSVVVVEVVLRQLSRG